MTDNIYEFVKKEVIKMSNEEKSFSKTSINWYPGHMAKTKKQIIKEPKDANCNIF